MKYPVHINGPELVAALDRVLELLGGSQQVLFDAMTTLSVGMRAPFVSPTSSTDFPRKRNEIAVIFRSPTMLHGLEIALRLFEETYREVAAQGGVPGWKPDDLLSRLTLKTDRPGETISLSTDLCWIVEWPIRSQIGGDVNKIGCDWLKRAWGAVVPPYVVNYLSTAATAHYQKRNDVAVALLSIAAEATLRDVLSSRGHSFVHGASSVDVYEYSNARVTADVAAGKYLVEFQDAMPLAVADFATSFPSAEVNVRVRRVLKKAGTRIDLNIRAPLPLHGHWSCADVATPAVQSIGGLGAALNVARNQERCVTAEDLAEDFDEVLQAIRNNLVHLSGAALDTVLPRYDSLKVGGNFTLRDFLADEGLVLDFVFAVSRFVTAQYVKLRGTGVLYT